MAADAGNEACGRLGGGGPRSRLHPEPASGALPAERGHPQAAVDPAHVRRPGWEPVGGGHPASPLLGAGSRRRGILNTPDPFKAYSLRPRDRGLAGKVAIGHLAGKLISVLFQRSRSGPAKRHWLESKPWENHATRCLKAGYQGRNSAVLAPFTDRP
jgi:hypothetical protein